MSFIDEIEQNNATHIISSEELEKAIQEAQKVKISKKVHFERSVFINWTCAIADCKYCYLSTKPKYNPAEGTKALRSKESILAEVLICREMGWRIGYITGGLRVESVDYLSDLVKKINIIVGHKIMMNFGPYSNNVIAKLKPHISGMGSAIESFDEELHNFICPSKPLKSLMLFLENLQKNGLEKLITIILGLGEKKSDVDVVIKNIKKYEIEKIQLCFLKPQENTVFANVPAPNPDYMAWWIAKIRVACPDVQIKVALVRERMSDISLYLKAGANGFSRFMVFNDFGSTHAHELVEGCKKADRDLIGSFVDLPELDIDSLVDELDFDSELKEKIRPKAKQYYAKLQKLISK